MAKSIVRGNPITLDLLSSDGAGIAVDVPDLTATIINANGVTVVTDDDNTVFVSTGHRRYVYNVAADALIGAWSIRWDGTISGAPVQTYEGFTVLAAGAFAPVGGTADQVCQPWATHEDAVGACAEYGVDPDELDVAMVISSDILWNLTRRKWSGVCSDSIRPQAQWKRWDGPPAWWPSSMVNGGSGPWGYCSCNRSRETGCARIPELRLPRGPVVADSISVMLNGEPFTEFRLDDGRWLVRTDGSQWPCCQDLLLDDTEPNTFSIDYSFGKLPPRAGGRMAALYGCQIFMSTHPDLSAQCKLPDRVTRVTRQGTTTSFVEPSTLVEKGMTGLTVVDQWVAAVNKGNDTRRASVMVPGRWRPSRRVGR